LRGAAVVLLDDERREDTPRLSREVADPEEHDRVEDPALPPELAPAFAQLPQERLGLDEIRARLDVDPRQQRGRDGETRGVDEDRGARTAGSHAAPTERRRGEPAYGAREAGQRLR